MVTSPEQRDLWLFTLREPMVSHLLGSPATHVELVSNPEAVARAEKRPNEGTVFFDVDQGLEDASQAIASAGANPVSLSPKKPKAAATITAKPNPIRVCDGSGLGTTTVSFTFAESDLGNTCKFTNRGSLCQAGCQWIGNDREVGNQWDGLFSTRCNRREASNGGEHGWHRYSHLNDSGMSISKALPTTELSVSIACVAAPYLSVVVLCYRSGRSMIPLIERLLCSFALQLHVGTRAGR